MDNHLEEIKKRVKSGLWMDYFNVKYLLSKLEEAESHIVRLQESNAALQKSMNYCPSCGWLLPEHEKGCGRYPKIVEALETKLKIAEKVIEQALIEFGREIYEDAAKIADDTVTECSDECTACGTIWGTEISGFKSAKAIRARMEEAKP